MVFFILKNLTELPEIPGEISQIGLCVLFASSVGLNIFILLKLFCLILPTMLWRGRSLFGWDSRSQFETLFLGAPRTVRERGRMALGDSPGDTTLFTPVSMCSLILQKWLPMSHLTAWMFSSSCFRRPWTIVQTLVFQGEPRLFVALPQSMILKDLQRQVALLLTSTRCAPGKMLGTGYADRDYH